MIYLFFDVETTGPTHINSELISLAMIATDTNYNHIATFNEQCTLSTPRIITDMWNNERNLWPDPVGGSNKAKWNATDIHGILWEQAKDFQQPVDMYRELWRFMVKLPKKPIKLVYHSQTMFDPKFLFYRCNLHAPKMYMELSSRCNFYEMDKETGEGVHRLRYDDTMGMARAYIRKGSDGLKIAQKLQKAIDKNRGYLTKIRKTPAKPEQIKKWQDALSQAENDMALMEFSDIELQGYSLDKICKSLDITLNHHNALSDTQALIPIHKFLSNNL